MRTCGRFEIELVTCPTVVASTAGSSPDENAGPSPVTRMLSVCTERPDAARTQSRMGFISEEKGPEHVPSSSPADNRSDEFDWREYHFSLRPFDLRGLTPSGLVTVSDRQTGRTVLAASLRELEILACKKYGLRSKQIGRVLGMAPHTVNVTNAKLFSRNTTSLLPVELAGETETWPPRTAARAKTTLLVRTADRLGLLEPIALVELRRFFVPRPISRKEPNWEELPSYARRDEDESELQK